MKKTINFGDNTYRMIEPAVGSAGTEDQAMHWATTTSSVTLKNGIFVVASGVENTNMGMQSHSTFTAENMVFDFENVILKHYDRADKWSTFGKPIFDYSKRENHDVVKLFNHNAEFKHKGNQCKWL